MSNSKISALTSATTVAGTEVLPIVQSSATVKLAISDLNPGLSTILASKGGTGQTSYTVGDLLYASATTTLSKLADVATGNALISGGVTTAPSWGKIGLTTHVSGTLPTANGGTNLTSFTANGVLYASSTSALTTGTGLTFDGTILNFGGTGNRITGLMDGASVTNRLLFQTSTTNSQTTFGIIPNGTSTASALSLEGDSTLTNGTTLQLINNFAGAGTESRVISGIRGTGTYLPITVYTGGSQRVKIDTSGNTLVTSAAGLGYGTGSGGTVTQATSKGTAVTLNKPTGQITMNNALLLTNTAVAFQVNNTLISATDTVVVSIQDSVTSNTNYQASVSQVVAGAFVICLQNISISSLSEAVVINFATIKGATS